MVSVETIYNMFQHRRRLRGPMHEQMRRVRDLANGDVIIPLNELDQNAKASVANLLGIGLEQMSMRVASTMPAVYFPPIRPGERAAEQAQQRRRAVINMWDHNRMGMKLRRRARYLLGYSESPVMIRPDFKTGMPTWVVRNPLDFYPAPTDDLENPVPDNTIFTFNKPYRWLVDMWGHRIDGVLRVGRPQPDTMFQFLEYTDDQEIVLCVVGATDDAMSASEARVGADVVELERIPNRAGRPLVVCPNRITLDQPKGQFDDMLGMYYTRARLQALTEIAIERGIFPDEYLVARQGENPEIVQIADGKTGVLGVVKGGDIRQQQIQPGYKTEQALDRLERQERLEGAIPPEFGGESGTNIRTGRRGENILAATVDFRVQEAQDLFAASLLEENKIAIAIDRQYFGSTPKSFSMPGRARPGTVDYLPQRLWDSDSHFVAYSASGSDVNNLVIGLGQRMGTGMMSKESAREADPLIDDPELEHDRIVAEGVESALLASIQQQAADPNGPYQPADLAYLVRRVLVDRRSLFDAVTDVDDRARERQATPAPPGPETMPGLALPGMGAEAPAMPPPGPEGIEGLLAQLGATGA